MKQLFWLSSLSAVLLCGCMARSGSEPMTMRRFQQIPLGISTEQLVKMAGKPYQIKKNKLETRYIYIERFVTPDGMRQDRRYIVEVSGGRVTNKYFVREGENTIEFMLRSDDY